MTIPNMLTMLRIVLIPVFLFFLLQDDPYKRLIAIIVFTIAALSDLFDGMLARKLEQDSKLGRFLDPLADKFLVITALFAFYYLDHQISLWMIMTIIGRDILITLMRYLAVRKGTELVTSRLAKTKTAIQITAISLILLIFFVRSYGVDIQATFAKGHLEGKKNIEIVMDLLDQGMALLPDKTVQAGDKRKVFAETVPYFLILITTLFTIYSGLRYIYYNYRVLLPPYYIFRKRESSDD